MQKPRKTERTESPRRTERQRAADKRRREEARAMGGYAKGPKTPEKRMTALQPGQVRITGLIVDELTRALGVILKLDGPADVLMKLFFRSNPRLGMRDRGIIAEGIYYALRHLGTLSWAMHPVPPARAPRLVALATLARQHGIESLPPASIGREEGPLKNVLAADFSKAPPHIQAELPEWIYSLLEAQYDDTKELYASMLEGAPLDLRVNLLKASREEVLQELAANGVEAYPTPFSPDGVRLPTKPGLTQWPIYKEGKVDVQDEGSQLIARLLTPSELDRINKIQKDVLEHASRLVKKGGRMVYATCSMLRRENQEVVEAFLEAHPEWHLVPAADVFAQQGIQFDASQWERFGSYFQMLPHVNSTDGFFAAVLQRD